MGQITVGPYYTGPYYSGPNYSRAKLPIGQITVGLKTGPSVCSISQTCGVVDLRSSDALRCETKYVKAQ